MFQKSDTRGRIIERFDEMSEQLQTAARYILDHPQEVALVSMRELSKKAGVQPATMTRLAKFLDLEGYHEIREHYAAEIRYQSEGFAAKAREVSVSNSETGSDNLALSVLQGLANQILRLCQTETLERLTDIADRMKAARRIYVLGLRSCHSVAWHFHYVLSLLGDKTINLDGAANTAGDGLIWAKESDLLLVISINPYVVQSLDLAAEAHQKGMQVVAITDSEVSPLVPVSDQVIYCSTESRSFFHTLTPALAVSEVLCALLAHQDREGALDALQMADRHLQSINTYTSSIPRRRI
ncbi:MurR/RpiR family transcriptional regulator [Sneathiella sp.]|mgnify:CR=1 FL=1|uniref:MurR/RpiR family transcriptional regulator n=1 Tax=Sneathiella sp. TaxID=1964365 RepID=UPI002FE0A373